MKKMALSPLPTVGPYSGLVMVGDFIFCSGQIPFHHERGEVIRDDMALATACCLDNVHRLLTACGSGLEDVVKTTIYLTDITYVPIMNDVYQRYFPTSPPARTTVIVSALPQQAPIEIEAIAFISAKDKRGP